MSKRKLLAISQATNLEDLSELSLKLGTSIIWSLIREQNDIKKEVAYEQLHVTTGLSPFSVQSAEEAPHGRNLA